MQEIRLKEEERAFCEGKTSKGNQWKWKQGDYWYKADYMGYESFSEVLVSGLLKYTNVEQYVHYDLCRIRQEQTVIGCRSRNFLEEGENLITLDRLFRMYLGCSIVDRLAKIEGTRNRVEYVAENVAEITGLENFGKYLTMLLEIDAFFLNEDRHMNNIAVIFHGESRKYRLCPVFDNGLALFADTTVDFPVTKQAADVEKYIKKYIKKIQAKPFARDFEEQADAAEQIYGRQWEMGFTMKEIEMLLRECAEGYDEVIVERVRGIMRYQMRKYGKLV
ncbi:MAG: hypothetical protein J6C54_04530 [Lachnospiraceae bacterium]|nr:hypothetical protein [Lachnospiraceae bacterium]